MDGAGVWGDRAAYLEQVRFVSEKTLSVVRDIVRTSSIPPIIVLQSDHGSAFTFTGDWKNSWAHPKAENISERMSILTAIYLPSEKGQLLDSGITPVNLFRVILPAVLGFDYERIEDRSYFSTYETPYALTDVTDRLKTNEGRMRD